MDEQKIIHALSQVEHTEIKNSLDKPGMVKDIQLQDNEVSLKLVFPFMGIPPVIRDYMINSLGQAIADQGVKLNVTPAEMTPQERQSCFRMEQQNWRG